MLIALIAIYGLLMGSFFNVLICRLPEKKSILFPASHCPTCKSPLKPWQNIPLISFIFLKGRCGTCRQPIALQYPLIELFTSCAAVAAWILYTHNSGVPSGAVPIITCGTNILFLLLIIPITIIDFKHYIIPDSLSLPFLAGGLLLSFLPGSLSPQQSLLGILAGGGSLYAIGWLGELIFKKEAMGGGDIKLMAAAGAFFGPQIVLLAFIFGAFLGAFYGIGIIAARKLSSSHQIPFGPFLGAGLWIAFFAGETLLNAYLHMMGV